jgi:glycosyltransferase involved in cell wall biosynthesis
MVEEGVTGHLVAPDDPRPLAEGLLKVVRDANLRRRMGEASHARFLKNFHAAAMAEKVEQVYERVLQDT